MSELTPGAIIVGDGGTGYISVPGAGANSEQFGVDAYSGGGTDNVAIGNAAKTGDQVTINVIDYTLGGSDTIEFTRADGSVTILTEGADFDAITSESVTAENIRIAIDAINGLTGSSGSGVFPPTRTYAFGDILAAITSAPAGAWTLTFTAGLRSTAVGQAAETGYEGTAIGANSIAYGRSVAIGRAASAHDPSTNASMVIAIGYGATTWPDGLTVGTAGQIAIGGLAIARGSGAIAIGTNATTGAAGNNANKVVIGSNSSAEGDNSVVVGGNSSAGNRGVVIGGNAISSGLSVAIGASANATVSSIAIGEKAIAAGANQLVIGGNTAGNDIRVKEVYIGSGKDLDPALTPGGGAGITDLLISGTSAITTADENGSSLTFASGKGTGAGPVTTITFQTPDVLGPGITQQSLATRIVIQEGNVEFFEPITINDDITLSADLLFSPDDTHDIGSADGTEPGVNRPRKVFVGTELVVGDASVSITTDTVTVGPAGGNTTIFNDAITVGTAGSGSVSVPGIGANSEQFGSGAYAGLSTNNTAVGAGAETNERGTFSVVNYALGAFDTITITHRSGTVTVLTEGTDFTAETSNGVTANNISAAIDLIGGLISFSTTPAIARVYGDIISVATGDASAWTAVLTTSVSSTAVGSNAIAITASIAIGTNAYAQDNSVAVGGGSITTGNNTTQGMVAIGKDASVTDGANLAIGAFSIAQGSGGTAIGRAAKNLTANSNQTAVGNAATSTGDNSTTLGAAADSSTRSTALGYNATASVVDDVAVGQAAGATAGGGVAVGSSAISSASQAVALGFSADATSTNSIAVGGAALASVGTGNIAIGNASVASGATACIALGYNASTTTSNQFVVGSASGPITTMYIGEGVTSATPQALTISGTGSVGNDIAGSSITWASGTGTGIGTPSSFTFQTPAIGVTGTIPQSPVTRMTIQEDLIEFFEPITFNDDLTLSADLLFSPDDTHDIGSADGTEPGTSRPRKIFVGTELVVGDTIVDTSSITLGTSGSRWRDGGSNAIDHLILDNGTHAPVALRHSSNGILTVTTGTDVANPGTPGSLLALRYSLHPSSFSNVGTFEASSGSGVLKLNSSGYIGFSDSITTLTTLDTRLVRAGLRRLGIEDENGDPAGLDVGQITTSGNLLFDADDTWDIGSANGTDPGVNRPRNVYVGTELVVGDESVSITTNAITVSDASDTVTITPSSIVGPKDRSFLITPDQTSTSASNLLLNAEAAGQIQFQTDNTPRAAVNIAGIDMGQFRVQFGSSLGAFDTALRRNGAGIIEVATQTAGVLRDFAARTFLTHTSTTDVVPTDLTIRAGSALPAATVNEDGAYVQIVPGQNATGGGTDGTVRVWHADEGANDYLELSHDATNGVIAVGSGTVTIPGTGTDSTRIGVLAKANGADSIAIGNTAVVNAASADGIAIGRSASVGSLATNGCIAIGVASNAGFTNAVAIGNSAYAGTGGATHCTALGHTAVAGSFASSSSCTAVGAAAAAGDTALNARSSAFGSQTTARGDESTIIGASSINTSGDRACSLGAGAQAAHDDIVLLGRGATSTAANQVVFGSTTSSLPKYYFGDGVSINTLLAPTVEFHATKINDTQTDKAGASIIIASGEGTGAGPPSTIAFQTPTVLGTGITQQTLTTRLEVLTSGGVSVAGGLNINGDASATAGQIRWAAGVSPLIYGNATGTMRVTSGSGQGVQLNIENGSSGFQATVAGTATSYGTVVDVRGPSVTGDADFRVTQVTTGVVLQADGAANEVTLHADGVLGWPASGDATGTIVGTLGFDGVNTIVTPNDFSVGSITVDDTITGPGDLVLTASTTGGGDLLFGALGGTITLNEVGDIALDTTSFAATSIIGALNEIAAGSVGGGGETLAATLALGNTTNGNNIVLTSGDQISGGFANFGSVQVNSMPLPQTLAQLTSYDLTGALGDTAMYTVPAGKEAVILGLLFRPDSASGATDAPNGDAVISLGTPGTGFDNILKNVTLTGLDDITKVHYASTAGGTFHLAAAGEVISIDLESADTGQTLTADIELIGYLV